MGFALCHCSATLQNWLLICTAIPARCECCGIGATEILIWEICSVSLARIHLHTVNRNPKDLSSDTIPDRRSLHLITMPLHKNPPLQQQQFKNESTLEHGQIQQRRRTLQTISELAPTGMDHEDFQTAVNVRTWAVRSRGTAGRPMSEFKRYQSSPLYCSSPACLKARQHAQDKSLKSFGFQPVPMAQTHHEGKANIHNSNYSRTHERGGIRHKQQGIPDLPCQVGQRPRVSQDCSPIPNCGDQSQPGNKLSQQGSLHRAKSFSRPQGLHRRQSSNSSFGRSGDLSCGYETEPSDRTSTDSSSYRASYDGTIRRSRSGSSTDMSCSSCLNPPPTNSTPPQTQRHYSMPNYMPHKQTMVQQVPPIYSRPVTTKRMVSVPSIRIEHGEISGLSMKDMYVAQQQQQLDIERARLESLAALTGGQENAASPGRATPKSACNDRQSLPSRPAHYTSPSRGSTCSDSSYLKPPPHHSRYRKPRYGPRMIRSEIGSSHPRKLEARVSHHQQHQHQHQQQQQQEREKARDTKEVGRSTYFKPRSLPTRETLTQWKLERDQAQTALDSLQRATKIREKSRRTHASEVEKQHGLGRTAKESKDEDESGKEDECDSDTEESGNKSERKESKGGCWTGFGRLVVLLMKTKMGKKSENKEKEKERAEKWKA